jgi:hypothetical protein
MVFSKKPSHATFLEGVERTFIYDPVHQTSLTSGSVICNLGLSPPAMVPIPSRLYLRLEIERTTTHQLRFTGG